MKKNIYLETIRLILKKMSEVDFADVAKILQNSKTMYAWEHAFSDAEVHDWISRRLLGYSSVGYDYFLAIEKLTNKVVGQIGLIEEMIENKKYVGVGYIIDNEYWGNGYAYEGANALINHAFENLNIEEIVADIRPTNISSICVAKKLGMKKIGEFDKHYNGQIMTHIIFSLTKQ